MTSMCKILTFLVFFTNTLQVSFGRPVPNGIEATQQNVQRPERQVVQPTWLTNSGGANTDSKVHITQQSLDEAAALRDTIKHAVEEDIFFVKTDVLNEPNGNGAAETVTDVPPLSTTPARPYGFFFDFSFPTWGSSTSGGERIDQAQQQQQQQQQQQEFMAEMQRQWLEFWEQSWRMLSWT